MASQLEWYLQEARLSAHVSERMLDLACLEEGSRVLDVACGRGEPSLRAARRAGVHGQVVALDVWAEAVADARERARQEGLGNITFRVADVHGLSDEGPFDAATARWGLMFFQEPVRALRWVHSALKPGGTLVAAMWGSEQEVSWWSVPRRVTERFADLPPVVPDAPGPFRYARTEIIERDFSAAGFIVERVEDVQTPIAEAETGEGLVDWAKTMMTRMVSAVPQDRMAEWERAFVEEAEQLRTGRLIQLGGVTRLVVATRR